MVSPALYNSRNMSLLPDGSQESDDACSSSETTSQPDFVHCQGDFPQMGERPVGKDGQMDTF